MGYVYGVCLSRVIGGLREVGSFLYSLFVMCMVMISGEYGVGVYLYQVGIVVAITIELEAHQNRTLFRTTPSVYFVPIFCVIVEITVMEGR